MLEDFFCDNALSTIPLAFVRHTVVIAGWASTTDSQGKVKTQWVRRNNVARNDKHALCEPCIFCDWSLGLALRKLSLLSNVLFILNLIAKL
jgi:hypothetical protein